MILTKGSHIIIEISTMPNYEFIAEITETIPVIKCKVANSGRLNNLKQGADFTIKEEETKEFQKDCLNGEYNLIKRKLQNGKPLYSALKSLGVVDDTLREILPTDE